MIKEYRAHPLMILRFIKPILFILVFPIIRAVIQYIKFGIITGFVTWEIFIFGLIVFYGIMNCRAFRVIFDDKSITVKKGFILKQCAVIELSKISSVNSSQSPFDALFGSMSYSINTEAGSRNKSDFEFKLRKKDARELTKSLFGDEEVDRVHFSAVKVAITAAATSSAFSGMLIGVPIINQAGKLLGIGLEEMFEEITHISQRMQTTVPPIVNTVTLIILAGYIISFVYSFIKYINFRIVLGDEKLEVRSGFFVKSRTSFKKKAIRNVLIVQNPLMRLLKRYSIKVSVGGFGEAKSESQIVVPAVRNDHINEEFLRYFAFLEPEGERIYPKRNRENKMRFLGWPLLYIGVALAVFITLGVVFKDFTALIIFVGAIVLCVLLYYTYICLYEYKYSNIILGKNVYIKGVKGFRNCRFYSPRQNIGQIKLTRLLPDKFFGTCRLKIIISSEGADNIKIRHIDYEKALKNLNDCFNLNKI